MFCSNCGTQLSNGVNFCPNCGAKVATATAVTTAAAQGNMVMLLSLGTCARATAAALLQQLCGYAADDALLIADSAPITVARGLTDAQARYLAQAFAEYGLEVSVYDGNGWRDWESGNTSIWDGAGDMLTAVAAALGLISVNNRISRDMMHRMDYPYRFAGARPPVYRLHSSLRAAPRRVSPVRPPVHRAAPPKPAPVHHAAPVRPVPQPARPAPAPRPTPQPVKPAPAPRPTPQPVKPAPAPRPTPQPARPANRPAAPGGMNLPGNGRPGGGTGRQGGPGRPGR